MSHPCRSVTVRLHGADYSTGRMSKKTAVSVVPCRRAHVRVFGCVAVHEGARECKCMCSGVWPCAWMPESTRACVQVCAVHVDARECTCMRSDMCRAHGRQREQVHVFRCVATHVDAGDEPRMSSSVTTHLVFLRQGLFLLFGICLRDQAGWTISIKDLSPLHHPHFGITGVQTPLVTFCSHKFCGSELSPVFELNTFLPGISPALC